MTDDDEKQARDLLQLPEDAKGWTAEQLARWLSERLGETLVRLEASTQRERALLEGLKLIAFEHEFCQACGQPEGSKCLSPGRCRWHVPPGDTIARQTLNVHKAALKNEADGVQEPADTQIIVTH